MSIWLEIHCDVRSTAPEGWNRDRPYCDSQHGEFPGVLAHDTSEEITDAIRHLKLDARDQGWVKDRRGWVCPNCQRSAS